MPPRMPPRMHKADGRYLPGRGNVLWYRPFERRASELDGNSEKVPVVEVAFALAVTDLRTGHLVPYTWFVTGAEAIRLRERLEAEAGGQDALVPEAIHDRLGETEPGWPDPDLFCDH